MNRKEFIQTSAAGVGLSAMPFSILKGRDDRKVRLGFIGVGSRGGGHLRGVLNRDDVEVNAICDIDPENAARAREMVLQAGKGRADLYTEGLQAYLDLCTREDIDGIFVCTPWEFHVEQSVAGMRGGKYVAVEIPAAIDIKGCWDLVNASEETGMPLMPLKNTTYQRDVLAVLNMARQGLFGELIHAQCGYQHNLHRVLLGRDGLYGPDLEGRNRPAKWRTLHYQHRNALLYPDHGTGAVCHWLDINRGNRFVSLTAAATKARGLRNYIREMGGPDNPHRDQKFSQGDIVTVTLTTANGETVLVIHDTSLPRGDNNKAFRLQGTRSLWQLEPNRVYIEGRSSHERWETFDPGYQNEFDSVIWKRHEAEARGAGHGGKDFFIRNAFIESVKRGTGTPLDVYDAATSAAIVDLSEQSIRKGGSAVAFPDFTRGRWTTNPRIFLPEELGY